jgi:hypothetical protein
MGITIRENSQTWLGRAALLGGGLIVLFWTLYFAGVIELGAPGSAIAQFEDAFLIADTILTLALIAAGIGLVRGKSFGLFFLIGAAAMTLYLGVLDLTFYARQGFYAHLTTESLVEFSMNLLCILGGSFALWFGWKLWRWS